MRRREFIASVSGAVAWSFGADAQPVPVVRRIGFLTGSAADDPVFQRWFAVFIEGLRDLGWVDGRNVQIEQRAAGGDLVRLRTYATLHTVSESHPLEGSRPGDRISAGLRRPKQEATMKSSKGARYD